MVSENKLHTTKPRERKETKHPEKIDTTISHKLSHLGVGGLGNMTDPKNRFSETRGGHKQEQEGVTNKK